MTVIAEAGASKRFILELRVYYEDTDAGNVVYYANYLRFFERARTEWLRVLGFEQQTLLKNQGMTFAARSAQIEYLKPARLDDMLTIVSTILELGRAQVVFGQRAERNGELLVDAQVRIVSFNPARGKAVAMPQEIHQKFKTLIGTPA